MLTAFSRHTSAPSTAAMIIPFGTANYYAFVAAGFCGVLSSSMNISLAAAVLTIEIFGLQYSFAAGLAAVVGFQVNRNQDIYEQMVRRLMRIDRKKPESADR